MAARSGRRRRRRQVAVALLGALVLPLAAPAGVASAQPSGAQAYAFTLRAGAVENYVNLFREIAQGAGFSRVTLTRRDGAAASQGIGAGVWTALEDEPCLLGCDPPCTSPMIGNPTMARASFPRSCDDQRSGFFAGAASPPGVASAPAPETAAGAGRATELTSFPGVRTGVAGSAVTAAVAEDGRYTGAAGAYIHDLVTATGEIRSVTSLMRVTAQPDGSVPKVTFAFSVIGASGGGSRTGINEQNLTIFGQEIPAVDVVRYFNSEVSNAAGLVGVLGQLGVRLLAPQVGLSDDGRRYRITSPVLLLGAEQGLLTQGLSARSSGVRLAGGVFEGSYDAPDAVPR